MDNEALSSGRRAALAHRADEPLVDAHRKAPTLLGGEFAGAGGAVRIWAPNRKMTQLQAAASGTGAAAAGLMLTSAGGAGLVSWVLWVMQLASTLPQFLGLPLLLLLVMVPGMVLGFGAFRLAQFLYSLMALCRPCYVTADAQGIGITRWRGSEALRWSDIARVHWEDSTQQARIYTIHRSAVNLNLAGYAPAARNDLRNLLNVRCNLQPARRNNALAAAGVWYMRMGGSHTYTRPGYRLGFVSGRMEQDRRAALSPPDEPAMRLLAPGAPAILR